MVQVEYSSPSHCFPFLNLPQEGGGGSGLLPPSFVVALSLDEQANFNMSFAFSKVVFMVIEISLCQ
jgi:hypothetical protein